MCQGLRADWKKAGLIICVVFLLFDVTFSSPAPVRSLASRLQLDLAEGSDGGGQSDYGEVIFASMGQLWKSSPI